MVVSCLRNEERSAQTLQLRLRAGKAEYYGEQAKYHLYPI